MRRWMGSAARTFAILAAVCGTVFIVPQAARADTGQDFLARMSGEWRGRGVVRTGPDEEAVAVLCKISANLSADRRSLRNSGRCSAAQEARAVRGQLTYQPGRARFRGTMFDTEDGRIVINQGSVNGARLTLASTVFDETGASRGQGMLTITLTSATSYSISSIVRDAETGRRYYAMTMEFKKTD